RAAALSFDADSDENFVSRRLVTEILNKPIHPINKEARSTFRTRDVDGYTDLVWCMENNSRRIYTMRFYVTSEYSPRYDVVLGKNGREHLSRQKSSKNAR
ncbi:hypothetical protein K469DRAFT_549545, partial [Zopfia rhizophila CBS 207.26]